MNLTVIKNDRPKENKQDLYYKAYERVLNGYRDNPELDIKTVINKLVFYGVQTVNGKDFDIEPIEYRFQFADAVRDFMATLTPGEFMNIFPATKTYDGDKWETKDYFYSMDYVRGLNHDEPIGAEILNFIWEYRNISVQMFAVHFMSFASDLRRLEGYPDIAEEWAAENGIPFHTTHTDNNGRKFMIDSHGRLKRIKTSSPKYLRVVQ